MELADNDRQRIEQEAYLRIGDKMYQKYFISGAEYATIYEREQQAKEQFQKVMDGPYIDFDKDKIFMDGDNNSYSLMTSSDPEKREKGKQIRIHELTSRIKQLEAERSELIEYNNNLEKALRICLTVKPHTESVDAMRAMIKTLLENSIKK